MLSRLNISAAEISYTYICTEYLLYLFFTPLKSLSFGVSSFYG